MWLTSEPITSWLARLKFVVMGDESNSGPSRESSQGGAEAGSAVFSDAQLAAIGTVVQGLLNKALSQAGPPTATETVHRKAMPLERGEGGGVA